MKNKEIYRITISDIYSPPPEDGIVSLGVNIALEKYGRKHFYSFRKTWHDIESFKSNSDDTHNAIHDAVEMWLLEFKHIEVPVINTSRLFKYSPYGDTRRMLIEKTDYQLFKRRKLSTRHPQIGAGFYQCIDDGTLKFYDDITEHNIYRGKECPKNWQTGVNAEKFLYIKNDDFSVSIYPRRLFKRLNRTYALEYVAQFPFCKAF